MIAQKQLIHRSEFHEIIEQDENADKNLELINGEIVEKMPSSTYSSSLNMRIGIFVGIYLLKNPIAHITDGQGGYDINDINTYAPDVGVVLKSRIAALPHEGYAAVVPDLVFEVVSPSDLKQAKRRIIPKREVYLSEGVRLLVYVYPERREFEVYEPDQPMRVLGMDDTLDCGAALPGFTLAVKDVFVE